MDNTIESPRCRRCGGPLAEPAVGSVCARCALADALAAPPGPGAQRGLFLDDLPRADGSRARLGHFELIEPVAQGGMGIVYKAWQPALNRVVAVKVLLGGEHASTEFKQRFRREAETLAGLQHPGIIAVFDIGEHFGTPYFAMEYIEGRDLGQVAASNAPSARQAAGWIKEVAEALAVVHRHGVVHRDLKPSNILLGNDGRIRITDFGVARPAARASELTRTGQTVGSPGYWPPEALASDGAETGPASDVYSLGAVLYYLLAGRPPFRASSPIETLRQVLGEEPVAPRSLDPSVPVDLETICLRCLEKHPNRRFATADELASELGRFLGAVPIRTRRRLAPGALWRRMGRRPAAAVAVGLLVLGLATLALTSGIRQRQLQRQLAVSAAGAAELAADRTVASERLRQAEWQVYASQVMAAWRAWEMGNAREAWNNLNAARWDFRGWEHDCLHTLFTNGHMTLRGHHAAVTGVGFIEGGRTVVSTGANRMARLYDVRTGEFRRFLPEPGDGRCVLALSANGRWIATGGEDALVTVWDAHSDEKRHTLRGHRQRVWALAFNADSTLLATGGGDGSVRVWDLAEAVEMRLFAARAGSVRAVAFSPNGRRLASAHANGSIVLWDWPGGEPTVTNPQTGPRDYPAQHAGEGNDALSPGDSSARVLRGHTGAVNAVAFAPDGNRLASGGADGRVRVWHVATNRCQVFEGHQGPVQSLAFTPNGEQLLSGAEDGTVCLWDADDGKRARSFVGHTAPVNAVAVSPDGQRFASASDDCTVRVWSAVEPGPRTWRSEGSQRILSLAWHPEGRWAVLGFETGAIQVRGLGDAAAKRSIQGHVGPVQSLAVSADGRWIASGGRDGAVCIWPADGDRERLRLNPNNGPVRALAFRRQDNALACAGNSDTVSLWNVESGERQRSWQCPNDRFRGLAFSPDGALLAGVGSACHLWEVNTGRLARSFRGGMRMLCVAWHPDGQRLAVASEDRVVRVWQVASGQLELTIPTESRVTFGLSYTRDGQRLVAGGDEGGIHVWNVETGCHLLTLPAHRTRGLRAAALSPDGRIVLTGGGDGRATLWHAGPPQSPKTIRVGPDAVWRVAFGDKGRCLVAGGGDGAIRMWDATSGRWLREFRGHQSTVQCLVASSDGRWILSGDGDGTVRLWDAANGQERALLEGHKHQVFGVALSPDAQLGVSASLDGTAILWDLVRKIQRSVYTNHGASLYCAAFSPDGKEVATGDASGAVHLWTADGGTPNRILDGNTGHTYCLAYRGDGRMLACGGADGNVRLFDLDTGLVTQTWTVFEGAVWSLAFRPDGQRVAATGEGEALYEWEIGTGTLVRKRHEHTAPVRGLAYSPDGRLLLTGSDDGTVRLWDAP